MEEERWEGGAESVLGLNLCSSIPICYHSQFGPHEDLLLLEVDDDLLPEILQNRVTIRGQPDEDAVLCTLSSTYSMKFVGTSNSVFLIPPGDSSSNGEKNSSVAASIITAATGNIELIHAAPKLDKLKKLLKETPYNPDEDFYSISTHKKGPFRWQDLVEMIQASEEEIRAALKSLSAVEIDGYWRIVDDKTMNKTLTMILHNSVLHGWLISALDEETVLSTMVADGFSPRIVAHCLETHGTRVHDSKGTFWELGEKQVCLRLARDILSSGKMKLKSFLERWEQSVPSGMKADLKMLQGEVLCDKIGMEEWIRVFSVSALPSTPADRFSALFQERVKWEWKDLEPYIRDIHVPGLSSEGLLMKYTRRIQPNAEAEPIYSAR